MDLSALVKHLEEYFNRKLPSISSLKYIIDFKCSFIFIVLLFNYFHNYCVQVCDSDVAITFGFVL